jgi:hypothetical protein
MPIPVRDQKRELHLGSRIVQTDAEFGVVADVAVGLMFNVIEPVIGGLG